MPAGFQMVPAGIAREMRDRGAPLLGYYVAPGDPVWHDLGTASGRVLDFALLPYIII